MGHSRDENAFFEIEKVHNFHNQTHKMSTTLQNDVPNQTVCVFLNKILVSARTEQFKYHTNAEKNEYKNE